jgi:hypothetical protein
MIYPSSNRSGWEPYPTHSKFSVWTNKKQKEFHGLFICIFSYNHILTFHIPNSRMNCDNIILWNS